MEKHLVIDDLINTQKQFWLDLQVHCIIECCGIDALELNNSHFITIVNKYGALNIIKYFIKILKHLNYSLNEFVSSKLLNIYEDKMDFSNRILKLLEKITENNYGNKE
ncbi:hypothetical protein DZC78_09715 [Olleya aquimaris]|uniref:Uncharacterized protein n=1 Tax=Olleya sediminilitoris TaxID=2795739 RepID=A0ABS1WH54_9FLAO|nr:MULTISPECIES: DUF6331 family protein [Olleya]AXO80647.1 hypothetical protein DZC78_09715 [Olleya aquimaris]MBL7558383.1 hypothetical protein [Olleya sediminilitoris]